MFEAPLTIFAALLGAATGGFAAPLALRWWFNPVLRIVGIDKLTKEDELGNKTTWYRLRVRNEGRGAATNSMGSLTMSWHDQDIVGGILSGVNAPSVSEDGALCWSDIGNPMTVIINPRTSRLLELVLVPYDPATKAPNFIAFPSETGWNPPRVRLRQGSYEGTVTVSGENAAPVSCRFEIVSDQLRLL